MKCLANCLIAFAFSLHALCVAEGVWQTKDVTKAHNHSTAMPDLTQFNGQSFQAKLVAASQKVGQVKLVRMFDQLSLSSFTAGERAIEWAKRQRSHPQAIVISEGKVTLNDIYESLKDDRYLQQVSEGKFLLRLPLVIENGAALVMDATDLVELRLSQERGAFISVAGDLFARGIQITGWSEDKARPAYFEKANIFRPFLVVWGGAGVYMMRANVANLGYSYSKSYGLSLSKFTVAAAKHITKPLHPPTGWILESTFEDLYFGFYCYEAKGVVLLNNVYKNNIVYGIDPHDRSEELIIAGNEVYGTKKKHGIIASREVNNSWIINNKSHHNHLSGIVLDRACEHNLIAGNEVYENGADGVTFYESSHNVIWNNHIYANRHHGVRIRNSLAVAVHDNEIMANGRVGLLGLTEDLSHTARNFSKDPYSEQLGLDVAGGLFAVNGSGALRVDEPEYLRLSDVELRYPVKAGNIRFRGFLRDKSLEILSILANDQKEIVYVRNKPDPSTVNRIGR